MDRIKMNGLAFYGYHGALAEENRLGQPFVLDVYMAVDLVAAGRSDDVVDTVHYGEAYEVVKRHVTEKTYQLIEALAENIAADLLATFARISEVTVSVKKTKAPVSGIFESFEVVITRRRHA